MTTLLKAVSMKAVSFLSLTLAALVFVPGPDPVFAEDGEPRTSAEPGEVRPAAEEADAEAIELAGSTEPGCASDLRIPEPVTDRTSPAQWNVEERSCPVADPLEELFPVGMGPPNSRRFCACGCGIRCEKDEDCGFGGVCIGAITCC